MLSAQLSKSSSDKHNEFLRDELALLLTTDAGRLWPIKMGVNGCDERRSGVSLGRGQGETETEREGNWSKSDGKVRGRGSLLADEGENLLEG